MGLLLCTHFSPLFFFHTYSVHGFVWTTLDIQSFLLFVSQPMVCLFPLFVFSLLFLLFPKGRKKGRGKKIVFPAKRTPFRRVDP